MIADIVPCSRKVQPFWMSKFITDEIEVAFTSKTTGDQSIEKQINLLVSSMCRMHLNREDTGIFHRRFLMGWQFEKCLKKP